MVCVPLASNFLCTLSFVQIFHRISRSTVQRILRKGISYEIKGVPNCDTRSTFYKRHFFRLVEFNRKIKIKRQY